MPKIVFVLVPEDRSQFSSAATDCTFPAASNVHLGVSDAAGSLLKYQTSPAFRSNTIAVGEPSMLVLVAAKDVLGAPPDVAPTRIDDYRRSAPAAEQPF